MRNFLLKILFRLLGADSYKKIRKEDINEIFDFIVDGGRAGKLDSYLGNCANEARNKFLYTEDRMFKGMALAFVMLRDEFRKRKCDRKIEDKKVELKKEEKNMRLEDVERRRPVNY